MLKWLKRFFYLSIILFLIGIGIIVSVYYHVKADLPDVASIQHIQLQVPMKVYSADGELISQFGEKRRIPLTIDQVPKQLIEAFIATEDSRYYQHPGIDPIGIARAAMVYITTGHAKQGASTITQQVARNFFLTREKTFIRKIKEIFIAIQLEKLLTKDQILMLYLNKISLGHRAYGVGAAAQVYYGKKVSELTLPEMAVLGGLPKAPSRLNPIYSPQKAMARRNIVLSRMLSEAYITQAEYEAAVNSPNTAKYHGAEITLSAHYAAEMARNELIERYGIEDSYNNGYNVYTTIQTPSQKAANKALINNLHAYDERHGYRGAKSKLWETTEQPWTVEAIHEYLKKRPSFGDLSPAVVTAVYENAIEVVSKNIKNAASIIQWDGLKWARPFETDNAQGKAPKTASDIVSVGDKIWVREISTGLALSQYPDASAAFVSINPKDGAITSMVGGFSFVQSKFNRVTQAKRQVGSNIKPFIYSAALDNGFTLATLENDTPINQWSGSSSWRPKNSPPIYNGPIRLRRALGQSKNVVSVRLVQTLGLNTVINQLQKFGFKKDDLPRSYSLALGSASITPLDLATGYAIIANGGYKVEPYIIERIEDAYGHIVYQANPKIVCKNCKALYKNNDFKITTANGSESTSIDMPTCPISPVSEAQIAPSVISEETAFLTRQLLHSAIWGGGSWAHKTGWNGTGWRAARALQRRDIGGKTGTTNDSKDAWFSGFLGDTVATSWVGFDNFDRNLGKTTFNDNLAEDQVRGGEFGAKTALPAWISFMKDVALARPVIKEQIPLKIATARIDLATGLLTNKTDYTTRFEYFKNGTVPTKYVKPSAVVEDKDGNEIPASDNELF